MKEMNIKSRAYYFLDDMVNIKILDPNNIMIYEKSYKNIITYYIGLVIGHQIP